MFLLVDGVAASFDLLGNTVIPQLMFLICSSRLFAVFNHSISCSSCAVSWLGLFLCLCLGNLHPLLKSDKQRRKYVFQFVFLENTAEELTGLSLLCLARLFHSPIALLVRKLNWTQNEPTKSCILGFKEVQFSFVCFPLISICLSLPSIRPIGKILTFYKKEGHWQHFWIPEHQETHKESSCCQAGPLIPHH